MGHQGEVDTVAWHPNCNLLVSGSGGDRSVRLWDINSGECVRVMPKHAHGVSKVAVSPDGTMVAAGTLDGVVQLWDVRKAEALTTLRQHRTMISSLTFSRGSQLLASGGADSMLAIWQPTACGPTNSSFSGAHAAVVSPPRPSFGVLVFNAQMQNLMGVMLHSVLLKVLVGVRARGVSTTWEYMRECNVLMLLCSCRFVQGG